MNSGNQELPVRKKKNTSPVPESSCLPQGPPEPGGAADPAPTPASLTDPRADQKAAGEGLVLSSSSDGSLLGPREPTVGNTHP